VTVGKPSTILPTDPDSVYIKEVEGRRPHHDPSPLIPPLLMRKIESQMIEAIQSNKDWKSGNTQVITIKGVSFVYLHGNQIATIDDDSMTIFDGGWQSVTTKSRLNALCDAFCVAGECVYQKNFTWYVDKLVGMAGQSKVFNTFEFTNGFVFAWGVHSPPFVLFSLTNMFRIASSLTTRRTLWVSSDNVALPAYLHAGANSSYKGSLNPYKYRCNPEAPNTSFPIWYIMKIVRRTDFGKFHTICVHTDKKWIKVIDDGVVKLVRNPYTVPCVR